MPEIDRFWKRVHKTDTCWLWVGEVRKPSGFGTFHADGSRPLAHRYSWEVAFGAVPEGKAVLQTCPTRHCVNPDHLTLGPKGTKARSVAERFWRFVEKSDDCWFWKGAAHTSGYGRIGLPGAGAGTQYAHRASWELHFDSLPEGKWVSHRCDVKLCVRPDHLFLSDKNKQNMADAVAKGRMPHGDQHYAVKVTDAQVAELRRLHGQGGFTQQQLADQFGISRPYVSDLVNRRRRV